MMKFRKSAVAVLAAGILMTAGAGCAKEAATEASTETVTEAVTEEIATATEAASEEEAVTSVMLAKLEELGNERGYCKAGEFGAEAFEKKPNEVGPTDGYLQGNYSDRGILSAKMDKFFSDKEDMIVFLNEDDGIHAELYTEKDGKAELVSDTNLNVNINNIVIGTREGEENYTCANDDEYMFSVGMSGGAWKLVIYEKKVAYDTNNHKVTVYDITDSGLEFKFSGLMAPGMYIDMDPDFHDDCAISIIHYGPDGKYIESEDTGKHYYGDEGQAKFKKYIADAGAEEIANLSDDFWQSHIERKWDYYIITPDQADLYISAYQENRYSEDYLFPHNPKLVIGENTTLSENAWWRGANQQEPVEAINTASAGDADQDGRFRDFFANNYAELAEDAYFEPNGINAKYAYADLNGDGIYELLIGDGTDEGVFAVVTEADGAYKVDKIYGFQNHIGPSGSKYIGSGCFVSESYLGNNYGGDFSIKILWKYINPSVGCREMAKLGGQWNPNSPSDELPQSSWTLYVVINPELPREGDDYESDPNYTREYIDYGSYYNRDTEKYANEVVDNFDSMIAELGGTDTLAGVEWKNVSDFN